MTRHSPDRPLPLTRAGKRWKEQCKEQEESNGQKNRKFGDGIFLRSFPSRRGAIEEEWPRTGYLDRLIKANGWLTKIETLWEIESIIQY